MTDITILRRTILWEFTHGLFPSLVGGHYHSAAEVVKTMEEAYEKFRFICADFPDEDLVRNQAHLLLTEMRGPALELGDRSGLFEPEELIGRTISRLVKKNQGQPVVMTTDDWLF